MYMEEVRIYVVSWRGISGGLNVGVTKQLLEASDQFLCFKSTQLEQTTCNIELLCMLILRCLVLHEAKIECITSTS
jgi:hypothetical protein